MTELEYITEAAERFYKEAGFIYPDNAKEYYKTVLNNPLVYSKVIIGKGFIVGLMAPSFLNPQRLQAQELAWYVEPEYRGTSTAIKLIKSYEEEAIRRGCSEVCMVCVESTDPEATGSIYQRLGYNLLEKHYIKEIL